MMLLTISSGIDSFAQLMTVLVLFLFVLVISWYTTRYVAKAAKDRTRTGNIELIETSRIPPNKTLQIIRVGNKYFCIAVCKDTVTLLGEIAGEELCSTEVSKDTEVKFQEILENMKRKILRDKK